MKELFSPALTKNLFLSLTDKLKVSINELIELKSQMDSSFMKIKLESADEKRFAIFELSGFTYRIPIYSEVTPMECTKIFKNSVLYLKLQELTSK